MQAIKVTTLSGEAHDKVQKFLQGWIATGWIQSNRWPKMFVFIATGYEWAEHFKIQIYSNTLCSNGFECWLVGHAPWLDSNHLEWSSSSFPTQLPSFSQGTVCSGHLQLSPSLSHRPQVSPSWPSRLQACGIQAAWRSWLRRQSLPQRLRDNKWQSLPTKTIPVFGLNQRERWCVWRVAGPVHFDHWWRYNFLWSIINVPRASSYIENPIYRGLMLIL